MNIGQRIYNLRKSKGYSQEELADKLGVTRQAVSKWEVGASVPELESVVAMAELFGVSTDHLLKGTEPVPDPAGAAPKQDWLDRLPGFAGKLLRKYGWLAGVYMAVVGCVFTGIGAMVRYAVNRLFGFTSFNDPFLDMQFSEFNQHFIQNNPVSFLGGAIMVIGIALIIGGVVLAIVLKKKSKQ